MDGRTAQRLRLAEKSAAELQIQNTHLSAQVLRMGEAIDRAARASQMDRLLCGALLMAFGDNGVAHIPVPDVDALRLAMATPPGCAIHTRKDEELGIWVIDIKPNPPESMTIRECSACGQDHVDPPRREPTDEEAAAGVLWVATCPTTHVDVYAAAAGSIEIPAPGEAPDAPASAGSLIQVVR